MAALSIKPHLSRLKLPLFSPPPPPFLHPTRLPLHRHRRDLTPSVRALQNQQATPPTPQPEPDATSFDDYNSNETYGEVNRIIGSRALPNNSGMEYLIEWKDDHAPTWIPSSYIAADVVSEFESPWWTAARKADATALQHLLQSSPQRCVDAIDSAGRTALHFVAGLGSAPCVKFLTDYGSDLNHRDSAGLTPLHMAAGYVRPEVVELLLDLGADPEAEDERGRTAVEIAREVAAGIPRGNVAMFARRIGAERVVRVLEEAVYEYAEVEAVVERRGEGERTEYLVRWRDGGECEWVKAAAVAEDLVRDFEEGLEYAVAEAVVAERTVAEGMRREVLVRWADGGEPTWEPVENVDPDLVRAFELGRERGDGGLIEAQLRDGP